MNNNFPFTLTTLAENPEYFEEVIALIEKEFHYNHNQSYASDFALLMDPLNFENCFLYVDRETNRVVSHLAACPRMMIKNNCKLNVVFIGGIATVKEFRGRDLFKKLMNHALQFFSKDTGLFILWSEITGLYEKFSFHLNGGLIETGHGVFTPSNPPIGFKKTTFKELSMKDFENIKDIYSHFNENYFFTVTRSEKEWSIIKEMNSIDLYLKKSEEGSIEQYFCINKGRDLTNIIHEIGCHPDQYMSLIKSLKQFKTWLPESELSLSTNKDIFFTAFMRLGNENILKAFLKELSDDDLILTSMTGDMVTFKFETTDYHASHRDFMQYLFGPKPLKEFEKLKLSPYITGTDSI
ncbi:MAG: GNAT family N-acetyltransferase [Bdellovibrionales bacterium]|nr:GNAT family N-acetyltransferase [Bdellovibrionales bacterium]